MASATGAHPTKFQSTRLREARQALNRLESMPAEFQSTRLREARHQLRRLATGMQRFNPRAYGRRDCMQAIAAP